MRTIRDTALTFLPAGHAEAPAEVSRDTDASIAFARAAESLELLLLRHEASLSCEPLPKVKFPHDSLVKVFETLVTEGIYARNDVPPWIHVSAKKGDDAWIFKVEDHHGIEFQPAHSDTVVKLFEKRAAKCRDLVEAEGGSVWAESRSGKSSAFFFSIPA